jgi:hypothetical protein
VTRPSTVRVRGSNNGAQGSEVSFYALPLPACAE